MSDRGWNNEIARTSTSWLIAKSRILVGRERNKLEHAMQTQTRFRPLCIALPTKNLKDAQYH